MWHSGLRGGVSLVLVMDMGKWVDELEGPGLKYELVNGTFVLIVVFLCIFGSTAGATIRCLGLPMGDQVPPGSTLYSPKDKHGLIGEYCSGVERESSTLSSAVPRPTSEAT